MSGLMWLTGTAESAPLRVGIPIGDLLAGYFCAIGILTALLEREVSGRGQKVETSLLEALTGSLSFQAVKFVNTGEVPPPVGNHRPLTAPMGSTGPRTGSSTWPSATTTCGGASARRSSSRPWPTTRASRACSP